MNANRLSIVLCVLLISPTPLFALDLVADGKPTAVIVVDPSAQPPHTKSKRPATTPGDSMAASVLADWIKKITSADVPIVATAKPDQPAIYVGAAAVRAGLKLDDIDSPTHEGLRVLCEGNRILLAGQNETSTVKAACRLLESLGCRYYMDGPLGQVFPTTPTLRVDALDFREKPALRVRKIWGSNWAGNTFWKIWNGAGGEDIAQGHAWGRYVPKNLFTTHPEYFALRNGARKQGDWYCTSNAGLRKVFAEGVMKVLAAGETSASISPPDGIGYCECDACRAQDDPNSIEPSSGKVSVTDRYVDFFNDVARQVRAKYPHATLSFYCYADYTQAPTRGLKLEPNLVAWVAPLRYCRLHAIDNPICPSRLQLAQMLQGWANAGTIAYRTYNYNLAECLVPFPMLSVWKHDIPYLKSHNAIGINLETLASWQIYGPHIYESIRLAYDPAADADRLMDDYYAHFYGPGAADPMKAYWTTIDHAFATAAVHAGSFFSLHNVYTPQLLTDCRGLLIQAATAAKNPTYAARIAMHTEGFENAAQYIQLEGALNAGGTQAAKSIYDTLLKRTRSQTASGYGNRYTTDYLKRFLGKQVEAAAAANHVVTVLPDQWRLQYDPDNTGQPRGYASHDFDDSTWKSVQTYTDTLDAQGLPDRKTIMWYRTTFTAPALKTPSLLFLEIDGTAQVFLNGADIGSTDKKRTPFTLPAPSLRDGNNTIAVRVDHSSITELFLGGIIRPIYLLDDVH